MIFLCIIVFCYADRVGMSRIYAVVGDGTLAGGAGGGEHQKPRRKFKKGDRTRRM